MHAAVAGGTALAKSSDLMCLQGETVFARMDVPVFDPVSVTVCACA
jgi:hypothetical protein